MAAMYIRNAYMSSGDAHDPERYPPAASEAPSAERLFLFSGKERVTKSPASGEHNPQTIDA